MGAVSFYHEVEGVSATECFNKLVDMAHREYGYDSYNGTISTCDLGRVKKVADKYSESVRKKAEKMIEDDDYGKKWVATCLDLGVVHYKIVSAKKVPVTATKEKAKFVQKYVVMKDYEPFKNYDTKAEAEEAAMMLALTHPAYYFVSKRPVNINHGEERLSEVKISTDIKNTKPKTMKKNSKVYEVHKYIFYGFAAE